MEKRCSVDKCDRPYYSKGWCNPHYQYWRRTGRVPKKSIRLHQSGRICSVDKCSDKYLAHGYCKMHYQRWRTHGDPLYIQSHNGMWKGDDVGYMALHDRISNLRGRAKEHTCIHCDEPARDWAYDHSDANEKLSKDGHPYSLDPNHYIPLCHSCHMKFDGLVGNHWTARRII